MLSQVPGASELADLQKGTQALIETIKDLVALVPPLLELIKGGKDSKALAADFKQGALKGAEKAVKMADLANRLLTLYDTVPRLTPDKAKSLVPAGVKKLPTFDKAKLDNVKKWVNVAKYTLETLINFYQCCSSLCDKLESREAANAAWGMAHQQLTGRGAAPFVPDLHFFAKATQSDLIKIIHGANSFADANGMAKMAIANIRQLKAEIERLSNEQDRHGYRWKRNVEWASQARAKLKETDKKLETFREQFARAPSHQRTFRQGVIELDLVQQIDEARGKIARFLSPVPNRIAPRGRLGPEYGPQ
jgi:hypothetical protein